MTTDCYYYALVCSDSDINMISLSDGKDLRNLKRKRVKGLGNLECVRWCNTTTSSLVVAHHVRDKYLSIVSAIQFE